MIYPVRKPKAIVGQRLNADVTLLGEPFNIRDGTGFTSIAQMGVVECKCGNIWAARLYDILRGHSCTRCSRARANLARRHHPYHKAIQHVWWLMRSRCNDPKDKDYGRYGGRGIRVCDEWREFPAFFEWALANGYEPGLQIDREDNDGNYEPGNCRFVTRRVQGSNRHNTVWVVAFGERKSASDWADDGRCQTHAQVIRDRIRRGWNPEDAITKETASTTRDRRSARSA